MITEFNFCQIVGNPNKPEGFAAFYVPIFNAEKEYRLLFGSSIFDAFKESARIFPFRQELGGDPSSKLGYVHFTLFVNEDNIKTLENISGWDMFKASQGYNFKGQDYSEALDEGIIPYFENYMDNYLMTENKEMKLLTSDLTGPLPEVTGDLIEEIYKDPEFKNPKNS